MDGATKRGGPIYYNKEMIVSVYVVLFYNVSTLQEQSRDAFLRKNACHYDYGMDLIFSTTLLPTLLFLFLHREISASVLFCPAVLGGFFNLRCPSHGYSGIISGALQFFSPWCRRRRRAYSAKYYQHLQP